MFSGCNDGRGWKEGEDRKDPGRVQQQQRGHKKPFRCSINTRVGRDQLGYKYSSPGIHTNKPNNDNNNKVWA